MNRVASGSRAYSYTASASVTRQGRNVNRSVRSTGISIIWQHQGVFALRSLILTFGVSLSLAASAQTVLSRHIYPLAPRQAAPKIVIDVGDAPESKEWGEVAMKLVQDWYPIVISLLSTQDFQKPNEIKLIFKKEIKVPAY